MQKFIERMITEHDELRGRIKRARKAVENPPFGADTEGTRMLAEQIKAMEQYLYWLCERIEHEEKK